MSNSYKKSGAMLFVGKAMLDMKKMKAELNELRCHLERNVEQRTEVLSKRIALLESCNTTLCDKLALISKELAALKQASLHLLAKKDTERNDRAVKLCIMNNQTQKLLVSNAQGQWDEHATAA
jgi:ribosome-binding ATPase YchF (GTP1/OBG family)